MMTRFGDLLHKLSNPHPVIEYILAGIVLLSTVVALVGHNPTIDGIDITTSGGLLDAYPLLEIGFFAMSLVALVHLAFLSVYPPTETSVTWRSRALGFYVFGFAYVSVLAITTFGPDNPLWINEAGISLISAVLYLNLKKSPVHANQ